MEGTEVTLAPRGPRLFEVSQQIRELLEAVEVDGGDRVVPTTGEVLAPSEFEKKLAELKGTAGDLVRELAAGVETLEAEADAIRERTITRAQARVKALESHADKARAFMRRLLLDSGVAKVKTDTVTVYLSKRAPKLEVTDPEAVPPELRKPPTVPPPDEKAIKAALERGESLSFARLVEQEPTLVLRAAGK